MNTQPEQTIPVITKATEPCKQNIGVAIAYCHKDYLQIIRLLNWIKRLGPTAARFNRDIPAKLILVPSKALPEEIQDHITRLAESAGFIAENSPPEKIDERGWPGSCSYQFVHGINQTFQRGHDYCLFIEPDAMPTRATWLQEIQTEWASTQGKREFQFYGVRVRTSVIMATKKENPYHEWHMSGIGIYPSNHLTLAPKLTESTTAADRRFFGSRGVPWDIWAANQTVPRLWRTELFFHRWGKKANADTDIAENPGIAVYHQCKDEAAFRACDRFFHGSKLGVYDDTQPLLTPEDQPRIRKRRFSTKNAMGPGSKNKPSDVEWSPTKMIGGAWYGEYLTDDPEKIVALTAAGYPFKVIQEGSR